MREARQTARVTIATEKVTCCCGKEAIAKPQETECQIHLVYNLSIFRKGKNRTFLMIKATKKMVAAEGFEPPTKGL